MAEQLAVALAACCIAVVLTELTWKMGGAAIPYLGSILPDPNSARSLVFAVGLAGAIGLVGGVVPASAANRIAAREALGSASTASPRAAATRSILVAAQVALCVALVVCGILVGRSFRHIRDTRIGIDTDRVVAITFDEAVQGANLDRIVGLQPLVRRLPGVEDVSAANFAPFLFATEVQVVVPGRPTLMQSDHALAAFNRVTADFFRSMGTRIVAGRPFLPAEESNGARVAIVNATLPRAGWPSGNVVGQCLVLAIRPDSTCTTVVGVAEDARRFSVVREDVGMQVYVPLTAARGWYNRRVVFVRTSPDPRIALASVRRFLRRQVPDLHGNARLLADIVEPQLRPWLLALRLLGFSGAVVLIITGIGLYGTLAVAEAQRRPEMAIRMALGARTRDILAAVGGRAARDTALGLAVGLSAAVFASTALQSLAYDLTPADVGIVAVACVLLVGVLCVAVLNPVRQVLRLDLAPLMRAD
jgi:putative ABC transport system permease protein